MNKITVPTGVIYTMKHDDRNLEFLCIGDYGKDKNIKADFLGHSDEINGVPNGDVLPLEEKMVVTISTQYGCSMMCSFCDVPLVGPGVNIPVSGLTAQVITALKNSNVDCTKRFNLHYARMGEPTWNQDVITHARGLLKEIRPYIGRSLCHPVVSTMMPKNNPDLAKFIADWIEIKNYDFRGSAGLQLSINSTDEEQRKEMFSGNAHTLSSISAIMNTMCDPIGRKYALNFALADDSIIDADKLKKLFPPNRFMVKITPLHMTTSATRNNITTSEGYTAYTPYKEVERRLKNAGFDVLVFIPSLEEDESRITCGNAILSDNN